MAVMLCVMLRDNRVCCSSHPMMVMVMITCDQREDRFHQVKGVDPSHHHQHLV